MAELTQQQKDLIAVRDRMQAVAPPDQVEGGVDRAPPGYTQPQTIADLNKAMPARKPQPSDFSPEMMQEIADAAAKVAEQNSGQAGFESGGGAAGMFGELARSMGEGIATIPDMPAVIGTGIENIGNRIAGRPLADPHDFNPFTNEKGLGMPVSSLYNKYLPPNPSFPGTRTVGNIAGPVLVTGPLAAPEATLPGLAARTAVTTSGVIGGGQAGEALGEKLAGEPGKTYGGIIGSGIGGGVVQPVVQWGGYRGLHGIFADAGNEFVPGSSASKAAAAERLGLGDHVSLGLLGNRFARLLEDIMGNIPGSSGLVSRVRRDLYTAYGDTAHSIAGMIDPSGTPPTGAISKGGLGQRANRVGEAADASISRGLDQLYQGRDFGLHTRTDPNTGQVILPRGTPSLPATQRTTIEALRNDPETNQAYQGPTLDAANATLRRSSNLIHDQAYENQLDARVQTLDGEAARLANDPTIDPATRAMQEEQIAARRAQIDEERLANRAPSFQSERTARQNDARTPEGVANDRAMLRDLRVARNTDMRNTAVNAGIPARFYDDVDRWASNLLGQRVSISNLLTKRPGQGKTPKPKALYTTMFGDSGLTDIAQMRTLIEHAPGPLREMLARQYELMTRGPDAGSPHSNPETFDPAKAVQWYDKQNDPTIREGYGPNRQAEQSAADLNTLLRAEMARPKRSVPGKGGNTLGSPGVFTALLTALGSGVGAAFTGASALTGPLVAGALTTPLISRFLARRFTDPGFTDRVIHPPTLGDIANQPNLSRILSSAVIGGTNSSAKKKR